MKTKQRHTPTDRKVLLLRAGLIAARRVSYAEVTRKDVAEIAQVAPTLVTHYFGDLDNLRREIMAQAILEGDEKIVAQGLARGDKAALKAPEALRIKAAKALAAR